MNEYIHPAWTKKYKLYCNCVKGGNTCDYLQYSSVLSHYKHMQYIHNHSKTPHYRPILLRKIGNFYYIYHKSIKK